jgi:uncharacterized protein (TIGR02996 family)
MRTFERGAGDAAQFWNVEVSEYRVTVVYGVKGTEGRRQSWDYATAEQAKIECERKVRAKQQDGYVETGGGGVPSVRRALEDALADNPDDVVNHMAYADWLLEQGEPRGELIQVQMQLEDESVAADERKRLQDRERELLEVCVRPWVRNLEEDVAYFGDDNVTARFARGWLDALRVRAMTRELAGRLAASREIRLLREMTVADASYGEGSSLLCELGPLALSAYVGNVRRLHLGPAPEVAVFAFDDDPRRPNQGEAVGMIKRMPRLEELRIHFPVSASDDLFGLESLGNLRVLEYNFGYRYALEELGHNRSLGNLTHLLLHPQRPNPYEQDGWGMSTNELGVLLRSKTLRRLTHLRLHWLAGGDEAVEEIVSSGILRRLKVLDIAFGWVSDAGARMLSRCRECRLQELNVSHNQMTGTGLDMLERCCARLIGEPQRDADAPRPYDIPGDEFYDDVME